MIKPNVEELRELLGEQVEDNPKTLIRAGRKLLDKVDAVIISRGKKGAVVVTNEGAWKGRCVGRSKVSSTVGCGDYLLAGFLKGLKEKPDMTYALKTAIKVATARAWNFCDKMSWYGAQRKIKVQVRQM
jgi:fructose-1-phosphate kinase PfkB-like protein